MVRWFIATGLSGRLRVAGVLLGLALVVSGCEARGGGMLREPFEGGVAGVYQGQAKFGFTFTCGVERERAVVRAQLEYHDPAHSEITVRDPVTQKTQTFSFQAVFLHGVAEPLILNAPSCEAFEEEFAFPGAAAFQGRYRPKQENDRIPGGEEEGTFQVEVFDQGEPGWSRGEFTGDGFSIELFGGRYNGYTRGGYIKHGNIQVKQDRGRSGVVSPAAPWAVLAWPVRLARTE